MSKVTRSVLITGGTGDLGYQCALAIAREFPDYLIVLAARKDTQNCVGRINSITGKNNVEFLALDLSSLSSTREFVRSWTSRDYPPICTLFLNAGIQLPGELEYTPDGIEKTIGVNHVAHALLFHTLIPFLAPDARIVVTASGTHDPEQKTGVGKPMFYTAKEMAWPTAKTKDQKGLWRYGTSKLINIMWTYALHRRLTSASSDHGGDWTVVAFDPGLMPGTGLGRDQPALIRFMWFHVLPHVLPLVRLLIYRNTHSPEESGRSMAWVGMKASGTEVAGKYLEQKSVANSSKDSYDKAKQEDLWVWTTAFIAGDEGERKKFETLSAL